MSSRFRDSLLFSLKVTAVLCLAQQAQAQQVFDEAKEVGRQFFSALLWLSGLVAMCGFMGAGHAFSIGDIERGKTLLRGTAVGTTCVFAATGIVQFIKSKFAVPDF